MRISEAFSAYASDVIVFRNQSAATEENHFVCMKALLVHFGDPEIESLTFPLIRDWKIALERTRSPETVRNYIVRLRVVLQYLADRGHSVVPTSQIPVPKRGDKVPDFITKEEVCKLIGATPVIRNKAIISLLYASGIRVSELCALDIAHVKGMSFTVVGKGKRARLCFIDERTRTLLDLYLESREDNNPALFTGKFSCHRITVGNVQELFRYARKNAGFKKPVHPHTMRHSFATDLLKNNANVRHVQELLGHASLDTTMQYMHVTNLDLEKVYREKHTI